MGRTFLVLCAPLTLLPCDGVAERTISYVVRVCRERRPLGISTHARRVSSEITRTSSVPSARPRPHPHPPLTNRIRFSERISPFAGFADRYSCCAPATVRLSRQTPSSSPSSETGPLLFILRRAPSLRPICHAE